MSIKTFTENFWSKLKSLYVTREEYIAGGGSTVVNNSLLEQGWELVSTTTANTPIILPELYTFDELYIEMNYDDGTMVHHTSLRKDSMLYDSTNTTTREIPLDTMQDVQTYVIYNIENNTIVPSYCEGALVDETSTNVTTSVYIKKVVEVAIDADMINYDNSVSGINSNKVQGVIDEVSRTLGYTVSKNYLPNNKSTHTYMGVTFTVNSNKSVTVNGTGGVINWTTLSLVGDFINGTLEEIKGLVEDKEYILSGCPEGGGDDNYQLFISLYDENNTHVTMYRDYGDGVRFTHRKGYKYIVFIGVKLNATVSDKTFYPMISEEGGEYVPYVEDVKTRVDRLYNVEEIEKATLVACKTDLTNVYTYTATKKCIISLSATAYYSNSIPKRIEIKKNGYNLLSANGFSTTTETLGALETTAFAILQKEETLKVYVGYQSNANNNIHLSGIVQYLE